MSEANAFLWDIDDFLAATGGRPLGDMPEGINGISIDTRTLELQDAFFAIKGDQFDGHEFVTKAEGAGASLAVVSEEKLVALGGVTLPLVVVGDVLQAMEQLGIASRARSKARIIAVTGSVGKTTTKEMLRTLLSASGKVHASLASYNNHWGVPLTLARMPQNSQYGIFEIGMNHPDEITPLVKMVRPHGAVITTVAAAHLGAFSSVNKIAIAKGEIFSGVESGGFALINRDIKQFSMLSKMAKEAGLDKVLGFGEKRGSKFAIKDVLPTSRGSHVSARLERKNVEFDIALPGLHMVFNLIAAIGAALLVGAEMDKTLAAVSTIGAVKGRGESEVYGEGRRAITLIDESYNANPASMEASLNVLGMHLPMGRGKRVAVLGDMLELGKSSHKLHKELLKPIRAAKVEKVWLVGEAIEPLGKLLEKKEFAGHFENAELMRDALIAKIRPGDVIMFKASLGIKFGPVVAAVKKHLSGN